MIHQLVCEGQIDDRAVVVTTLRTLRSEKTSKISGVPASTAITAYYVVLRELASALVKTDLFYSSNPNEEDQISIILQDKVPDIIRRREQVGRVRELVPSPEELENDLRAVFGKYGGPMPVYRFVCDQANGGIISDKGAHGIKQVMRGVWSGKGLKDEKAPSPKEIANSVPTEGAGELDLALPQDADPQKCMVFDEPAVNHTPRAASDIGIALCAAFPEIAKQIAVDAFGEKDGFARLIVVVKGGVPENIKLKLSNFLAEYGCSNPEETFSADGDWIGAFDFKPEHSELSLCESVEEPVSVIIRVPNEFDKECWVGCSRTMQDLSKFDGGEVTRVFAVDQYSKGMDSASASKRLVEGSELVLNGNAFRIKSADVCNGRIVVEARRVISSGQAVYDFPAEIVERLSGPCGLPRRDEEMFRTWASTAGEINSFNVLGESYWCDEPAFGEPCECVKVLMERQS